AKDVGEKALENALKYDTTDPAKFERMNLVAPYLPELKKHSAERVAAEREYDYVREDIQQFKKMKADKTFSLNESQRLKEKEEAEARQRERDKERRARPESPEKVYELTLKQCGLPGLPPPVEKTNLLAKATNRAGATAGGKGGSVKSGAGGGGEGASAPTGADLNLHEKAEEKKTQPLDVSLSEAEHILVDYIALLAKGNVLAAGQPPVELNRKD